LRTQKVKSNKRCEVIIEFKVAEWKGRPL